MEMNFGGVRWMCQTAEDIVIFSEQSGFYGRTKKVCFRPHGIGTDGGIQHKLCVSIQLQDEQQSGPIFEHLAAMHEIAAFTLGLDRFCPVCWTLKGNVVDCAWCAKIREERKATVKDCGCGHRPIERTDGARFCGDCSAPLNEKAEVWRLLPDWLQRLSDVDFDRITAYRKARWGLDHR